MAGSIDQQLDELNGEVAQLYGQGRYEQALNPAIQARDLTRRYFGETHPAFATSLNNLAELYKWTGNYVAAEPLFRQALEIRRKVLGKEHPALAISLNNLAQLYKSMGNYAEAESLYRQALEIRRRVLGKEHPDFATSLSDLALLYQSMSNYAAAEPLYRQAMEVTRKALGEEHPNFATSLNNLAGLYQLMGNHAAAESLYRQALEIRRRVLGKNHPDFAASLNNLALLYKSMGNYAAAEPLYRQASETWRVALGKEHPNFATSLNNLAALYKSMGDYAEAELLYRQALEIRRRVLGKNHPAFATSLNNLALLYQSMGNYAAAEPLYRQASETWRVALGKEHPNFATSLNNLALLYQSMGDYAAAEPLYRQASETWRVALGKEHPDFAKSLNNLALLYYSMGNYAAAEPLYRQAMEVTRKALGEEHPDFATSLNNLAGLYQSMGNYAAAEPLYRQAMEVTRKALGEEHPDFATSLNNLAGLYYSMGNYAAAESLCRQAMEATRKALGEEHPNFANSLNNLALLYQSMGDYAAAEPLYRQAMEVTRKALGEEHPDFAKSLNNLAGLYYSMGNYAAAESLCRQAMETRQKALGEEHPDFADSLNNLAALYQSMGDYAAAEPLYRRALEIRRKALGEEHPDFAKSLNNLAVLCGATHRQDEALALIRQATAINDRMIGQVFSIGSESQRMAYVETVQGNFDAFLSLVVWYLSKNTGAVRMATDLVLRRKAIGAEALAAQRDAVLSGKYPGLEPNLKELTTLRMQIAKKFLNGPGAQGLEAHRKQLAEWNARKEQVEAELARQIPEMNLEEKLRNAGRDAVALALPEGSVLVEFVRFNVFDFEAVPARGERRWKPAHYLAFALSAGEPDNVQMIDLGEADPIDKMIATFRAGITGEAESRGTQDLEAVSGTAGARAGFELRTILFDPLQRVLGGRKCLLLAPDGNLSRLPFEVLPTADGRRVIDEYHISYLGAGRDILRFRAPTSGQPSDPLVIADPDFDLVGTVAAVAHTAARAGVAPSAPQAKAGFWTRWFGRKEIAPTSPPPPATASVGDTAAMGRQSRDLDWRAMHFARLPGTHVEGERIAQMLGVRAWLEGAALEARLKADKSPRILHLATHGFFLPDQKPYLEERLQAIGGLAEAGPRGINGAALENPLLRSGLALAGANTGRHGGSLPPEAEDGILTAEDVSGMDLLNTELVVLSACETGLGEVRTGEGVFGLRRSFVLAGTRGLVMSLWRVPDEQTQELMEDFYRRILDGRLIQSRAEALRAAQLEIKKKYRHPLYWGGFIYQGDPFSPS